MLKYVVLLKTHSEYKSHLELHRQHSLFPILKKEDKIGVFTAPYFL